MMPPHEFRFGLWGLVAILVFTAGLQTLCMAAQEPSWTWWMYASIYVVDVFIGFVAACCLASLP